MSIYPPDDVDIIDLENLDRNPGGGRRQSRQSTPPPPLRTSGSNRPAIDPRFLVPLLLFLLALLVIGLAWRSRGGDEPATTGAVTADSEIAQSVIDAELRAGFDGLTVTEVDGALVIEGIAANATDVAAIGAVARSVEGSQRVDNRVVVEGGSIDTPFPATASPATNGGADLATQLNSLGRVSFEAGSSDLTNEGAVVLDNVARLLEQSPGIQIEVHGHTDSDGDESANQVLSQQRAEAVATALSQRGINATRITAVGFGELNPIAPNITAEGRATNRRIEFVVQTQ